MKIYLVGPAGFPNFGDELILKNWVAFILQKYPDSDIWIDAPNPTNIACYFSNARIHVTNVLWRLIHDAYTGTVEVFFDKIARKIRHLGTPNYDIALMNIWDVDIFHIIGGGYINSIWPAHLGLLVCGAFIKKISHCKLVMTGAGLLPTLGDGREIKEILSQYDFVECRDTESAEVFAATFGCDDAYLNLVAMNNAWDCDIPDVMLSIQHDQISEAMFFSILKKMEVRIKEHQDHGLSVGYVEAIPGSDRIAYDILGKNIAEDHFFSAALSINLGLPMKSGQCWYSTRFHHHLIASLYGCSGVVLGVNNIYYDIKHASLYKNGTGWLYWGNDVEADLPYPALGADFTIKSMSLVEGKRKLANEIYDIWLEQSTGE